MTNTPKEEIYSYFPKITQDAIKKQISRIKQDIAANTMKRSVDNKG